MHLTALCPASLVFSVWQYALHPRCASLYTVCPRVRAAPVPRCAPVTKECSCVAALSAVCPCVHSAPLCRRCAETVTEPRMTKPRKTERWKTEPRMTEPRMTEPRMTEPRIRQNLEWPKRESDQTLNDRTSKRTEPRIGPNLEKDRTSKRTKPRKGPNLKWDWTSNEIEPQKRSNKFNLINLMSVG